ncbi:MAG TPA: filamentous hemagglutinin N-terminal domain-containing protein [Stenomitos sp.]
MVKDSQSWNWRLGLAGFLAVGSAIALSGNCTLAQSNIVPDNTLGAESSVVIPLDPDLSVDVIDNGVIRGANLFHSFLEFNVSEGRGAYFYSPSSDIQNILARVTGRNPSEILGTLGTFGSSNPNLFLINPNGIIFGSNASLDMGNAGLDIEGMGGSFVATTANAILLGDRGIFNASEPAKSNLLAINPSAFFFNAMSAKAIINQSSASSSVLGFPIRGLQVPNGRSLVLLGGDVTLDGGNLNARGGRVELGGVVGSGVVGLSIDGNNLRLSFPDEIGRADVRLIERTVPGRRYNYSVASEVNVTAAPGGNITINAHNVNIMEGSSLESGIGLDSGVADNKAGNIEINATDKVTIDDSHIVNRVDSGTTGNAGNIVIRTHSLSLFNGAILDVRTEGQGNAGNVMINAMDSVSFDGVNTMGSPSAVYSNVDSGAVGNGGDINIKAGSLSLTNGGLLQTVVNSAFDAIDPDDSLPAGRGNAGNVNIDVRDAVTIVGLRGARKGLPSLRGAYAGVIRGLKSSGISSFADVGAVGNGGDINIKAGSLFLMDGGQLNADIFGQGNAGNVNINVRDLLTLGGTNTYSFFEGDKKVTYLLNSAILSQVGQKATGNGGDINIHAGSLSMSDVAEISASTFGQGNAGNVSIWVNEGVSLTNLSSIRSVVEPGGIGSGRDINIQARSLTLTNGSQIVAGIFREIGNLPGGQGSGGNIRVDASDFINLSGVSSVQLPFPVANPLNASTIFQTEGISSGLLTITERGAIGQAGNITVNTKVFCITNGAVVSAQTENSSNGGNIIINANTFEAQNGGQLLTSTYNSGRAGNIVIKSTDSVTLVGSDSTQPARLDQFGRDIVANDVPFSGFFALTEDTGTAGNVTINTPQLTVRDGAQVSASTSGMGRSGNIFVQEADLVLLSNKSSISTESRSSGEAGDVTINTQQLTLLGGSEISAETVSSRGGNIRLQGLNTLQIINSLVSASTETGTAGDVTVNATDSVQLSGAGGLSVEATQGGTAGNLTVKTGQMSVRDGAQVTVSSPQGQAGNLSITANSLSLNQGTISAETAKSSIEGGANITLQGLDLLRMDNESLISANALGNANGGNVTINSTFIVATPPTGPEGSDIIANADRGNGGRVNVTTQGLFGIQFRPQRTPKNDITVSSTFGLSGEYILNTPGVDPSRGLAQLPTNLVHAEELIDRHCTPNQSSDRRSSFTVTGRGGLPPSPNEPLRNEEVITNWITLPSEEDNRDAATNNQPTNSTNQPLVEAQGWAINEQGQVVLTAETTTVTPQSSWLPSPSCPASQTGKLFHI